MFTSTPICLRFVERVLGGVPKNPELLKSWLQSRAKPPTKAEPLSEGEWAENTAKTLDCLPEPTAEASWNSFRADGNGIFLPEIHILAFIRDMASTLGYLKSMRGLRQTLQHTMAIDPSRVRFLRDGRELSCEDGYDEHAIHVLTPQGPRTSIVRSDYVEIGTELRFAVLTAEGRDPKLSPEQLREFFEIGGRTNGIGSRRSQGFGRFEVL